MVTEFDAVPELVPDWNRRSLLASEMHGTKAHRLTSQTQPSLSPAKPAHRGFLQLPPSFVTSRASVGEVDRGRCHFSVAKRLLLAGSGLGEMPHLRKSLYTWPACAH